MADGRIRSANSAGISLVDLELEPATGLFFVGDIIEVRLIARSDSAAHVSISSISAALQWDAAHLELVGNNNDGPYFWLLSLFPDDSGLDDLNGSFLDGDAFYQALSIPAVPAVVPPEGLHVTTLLFEAIAQTPATTVEIVPALGSFTVSQVGGTDFVGQDVTGQLGKTDILVCGGGPGDDDLDGVENCFDSCPLTPVGEAVDSDGCSCSQLTCDDGLFCTGIETCDALVVCVSTGNPCGNPAECDEATNTCGGGGVTCNDVQSFRSRCTSKIKAMARMLDHSHDGDQVTISVDGNPVNITVVNRAARYTTPATPGAHTVRLDDPPGCFNPIEVNCPSD